MRPQGFFSLSVPTDYCVMVSSVGKKKLHRIIYLKVSDDTFVYKYPY